MLIKIYNSKGIEQVELSPNDNSTLIEEIQGDSILALSFTHFDYLELDVDFYTDFEGKRYWLTEKYKPKQNNKKEWVYDVKFYGVESMLKRLLVIKTVDDEEDPVFTLTAPPHEHVAMIVDCMNKGMGNISDWKVGRVDGVANIVIDYFGKYCDEALREIAEKVGGEWWAEGQTVNICKCEHGETVKLGYGNGLLSIDPGTADNVKFYTRLYPVGSSKNIDKEHYGFTRLQLPDGKKFVEINADKYGRVDHYEQDAFSEIYPRRIGTVSSVRSEEVTGEDGNPFTIYYFKDNSLSFDPNDYLLPEKVIRVSFQEGSELGGLGNEDNGTYYFEVNFDSKTREFEIITIWPYGNEMQLPGELLVPKPGDKYILWNLRMPDEYYALAEQEFLEAVNKYNEDHGLDIAVYKAPTDHVWIEQNKIDLSIGRRVRLESDEYFPGIGYRDSRITKITRKVNLPSSMDIEISDALSRTSQQKMSDEITDTRHYVETISQSVSLPDIIRTGDNTMLTDNNLLSALRVVAEITKRALSRLNDDEAKGLIKFLGGLEAGDYKEGFSGSKIDKDGNAEFSSLVTRFKAILAELQVIGNAEFREMLSSPDFISGFLDGKGWALTKKFILNSLGIKEAKYSLELDELIVRGSLKVFEMVISQLLGENDNRVFTGMLEVDHYDPETGRIWLDTKGGTMYNPFRTDDYIKVQQYNGIPSEKADWQISKGYELIITKAGIGNLGDGTDRLDWVEFKNFSSLIEGAAPEDLIAKGDTFARIDNDSDPDRKGLIQIISVGSKTPYLDVVYGLKTDPENSLKVRLGNLQGIRHHLFGWLEGWGMYTENLYAVGSFRMRHSGDDIESQIQLLKDRFSSLYSNISFEITEEDNLLYNASFTENMDGWHKLSDTSSLIWDGDMPMLMNGNLYIGDGVTSVAKLSDYEGRTMLYIFNSGVRQDNSIIIDKLQYLGKSLTHKAYDTDGAVSGSLHAGDADLKDGEGHDVPNKLYLSIKCLALTSGTLSIGFRNTDGSEKFGEYPSPMSLELEGSSEWQTIEWEGSWDGKGDFILEYTGEMYVELLSVTDDPLDDYRNEYGTLLEQTSRNIKLVAWNTRNNSGSISSLEVRADAIEADVRDLNGSYSNLKLTVDGIYSEVYDEERGIISRVSQNADKITSLVGDFSGFKSATEDDISDLQNDVTNLDVDFNRKLSDLKDRLDDFYEGETLEAAWAERNVTIDEIRDSVNELKYHEGDGGMTLELWSTILDMQSDIINISANYVKSDDLLTLVKSSGVFITSDMASLYASQSSVDNLTKTVESQYSSITARFDGFELNYVRNGETIADINASDDGLKIQAKHLELVGDVTINNVFSIDERGNIIFTGVLRESVGYGYDVQHYNVVHMPVSEIKTTQELGFRKEYVGQTVRVYNPGNIDYAFQAYEFDIEPPNNKIGTRIYYVAPLETIELTCFQKSETRAVWILTNRSGYTERASYGDAGRFPILWAMGTVTVNPGANTLTISGRGYDGFPLAGRITGVRHGVGDYELNIVSGFLPGASYSMICQCLDYYDNGGTTPSTDSAGAISIRSKTATQIKLRTSGAEYSNDCSFDFMIYSTEKWFDREN